MSNTGKAMGRLYAEGKLHTVVVSSYAVFDGWADREFMPVLADNRKKFKAMWGKPDFYFMGSHYFHAWVKKFERETFLVMTAREHGTVIEMAKMGAGMEGRQAVVASFAKALLKEMQG